MRDRQEPDSRPGHPKKPYSTPNLIEYGSVAKLTQTGAFSVGDATMMMMPCL